MTGRFVLAAGAVLAAACVAAGQVRVMSSGRTADGRGVAIGVIEPDPEKELQQMQAVCQQKTAAAQAALGKKLWTAALRELDSAQEYAPSAGQIQAIRRLYETIEAEGRRRLGAADKLIKERKYEEALSAYESITRTFGLLPSAAQARQRLAQARTDPEVQGAIQQARADKLLHELQVVLMGELGAPPEGAAVPLAGIKSLSDAGQDRAMELLERVAATCPDCPAGQAAASDLKALQGDKAFFEALLARRQGRQADGVLTMARQLRQGGRLDRALVFYRRLQRQFPQTPAAARAKTEAAEVEALLAAQESPASQPTE